MRADALPSIPAATVRPPRGSGKSKPQHSPAAASAPSASYDQVYCDQFVTLSLPPRTLTIQHYVLLPSLTLPLESIRSLAPASAVSGLGVEPWGVSLTGIGWGRDWRRLIWGKERARAARQGWVVRTWWGRVGFSTVDPEGFERVVRAAGIAVRDGKEEC